MEIREPDIRAEDILVIADDHFHADHVCVVSGCGTGIGRACAITAAVNQLMVVGLDINEEEAKKNPDPGPPDGWTDDIPAHRFNP
jgi:3-hydroxybutyrate dehydrogenase